MNQTQQPLTRAQIRSAFRRHYGASNQLAIELGVHRVTISQAIRGIGQYSEKIHAAVRDRAAQLIAEEQTQQEGAA